MTTDPEPLVEIEVELDPDGIHLVVRHCPHCGETHYHGVGPGVGSDGTYGTRISHCRSIPAPRPDYLLIPRQSHNSAAPPAR